MISPARFAFSSPSAKRLLNLFGVFLGFAGLATVSFKLWAYRGELDSAVLGPVAYAALTLAAVLSGASNTLLALAWRSFLIYLGALPDRGWSLWAYSTSQIAKYIPGNIFHYASRQMIGAAAGIEQGALVKSAGLELIVIAAVALQFFPLVTPILLPGFPVLISVAAFLCIGSISPLIVTNISGKKFGQAVIFYLFFLSVASGVFILTFIAAGGPFTAETIPMVGGAYVLAWLLGLITPGAPAGVGVREAVLLYLLAGMASPPVILLAVVLGRAITVAGDLLFYAWGQMRKQTLVSKSG